MEFTIRRACEEDASEAVAVLRQSITELCISDHHDEESEISAWLANKTETAWTVWLHRSDASVFVAEKSGEIIGVGMIDHSGEILLNYIAPNVRFCGISKALLDIMEDEARNHNVLCCAVESTITAKKFYESCGYKSISRDSLRSEKQLFVLKTE